MLAVHRLAVRLGLPRAAPARRPLCPRARHARCRRRRLRPLRPPVRAAGRQRVHVGERVLRDRLAGDGVRQVHRGAAPWVHVDVVAHPLHQPALSPPDGRDRPAHRRAPHPARRHVGPVDHRAGRGVVRGGRGHLVHGVVGALARHRHVLHRPRRCQQDGHSRRQHAHLGSARLARGRPFAAALPTRRVGVQAVAAALGGRRH